MTMHKILILSVFTLLFGLACGSKSDTTSAADPAPADPAPADASAPADEPAAPVTLTEEEKQAAQAGITKENADSEADKLLKEIDGI